MISATDFPAQPHRSNTSAKSVSGPIVDQSQSVTANRAASLASSSLPRSAYIRDRYQCGRPHPSNDALYRSHVTSALCSSPFSTCFFASASIASGNFPTLSVRYTGSSFPSVTNDPGSCIASPVVPAAAATAATATPRVRGRLLLLHDRAVDVLRVEG